MRITFDQAWRVGAILVATIGMLVGGVVWKERHEAKDNWQTERVNDHEVRIQALEKSMLAVDSVKVMLREMNGGVSENGRLLRQLAGRRYQWIEPKRTRNTNIGG